MASTFVNAATKAVTGSTTSCLVTLPGSIVAGNLLVTVVGIGGNVTGITPAAGWTLGGGFFANSSSEGAVLWKIAGASETNPTHTLAQSGFYWAVTEQWSGATFGVAAGAHNGSAASCLCPAVTDSGQDTTLVADIVNASSTFTTPSGFSTATGTQVVTGGGALAVFHKALATANPPSVTVTQSATSDTVGIQFTLHAASSSVALSGQAGTGSAGVLAATASFGLTGQAATGSAGSFGFGQALAGAQATGAIGTLGVSDSIALTGKAATGTAGTLIPTASFALTGVAAAGSDGTLAVSASIPLTGVAATGSIGALSSGGTVTLALTGIGATGSVGTLAPTLSLALTGKVATGSAGVLAVSAACGLTGVSATGSAGAFSVPFVVALTGVQATGLIGQPVVSTTATQALTGILATISLGGLTVFGWAPDPSNPETWTPTGPTDPGWSQTSPTGESWATVGPDTVIWNPVTPSGGWT